jgi:hypothetical protein
MRKGLRISFETSYSETIAWTLRPQECSRWPFSTLESTLILMKVVCADTEGFHFPLGLTTDFLASRRSRAALASSQELSVIAYFLATVLITIQYLGLTVKYVKVLPVLHASGTLATCTCQTSGVCVRQLRQVKTQKLLALSLFV